MRRSPPFLVILIWLTLGGLAALAAPPALPTQAPAPIVLGHAIAVLTGPWSFHLGDDPHWKDAVFDDADWEHVDLTPRPGAHDPDVGLKGYVPGWNARGHRGYAGYAWYRLRVTVQAPAGQALALEGPPYVDGAYQLFLDGRLLGGAGRFDCATPKVYGRQPRLFPLPPDAFAHGPGLLAIRVYTDPALVAGDPKAGGIHIAPEIGDTEAVRGQHQQRWTEVFWGYAVDGTEALIFLALAGMAAVLAAFDRPRARTYPWLAAALMVTGLERGNQNVFFWLQVETLPVFLVVRSVILIPLELGAWAMTWRSWFGLPRPRPIAWAIAGLTLIYVTCQLIRVAGLYAPPRLPSAVLKDLVLAVRLCFLALMLLSAGWGLARGRAVAAAVAALLIVGVGLFSQELSLLGVRGIWFPFGVGVSLTEYAYAVFDGVLFALLLTALLRVASARATDEAARRALDSPATGAVR